MGQTTAQVLRTHGLTSRLRSTGSLRVIRCIAKSTAVESVTTDQPRSRSRPARLPAHRLASRDMARLPVTGFIFETSYAIRNTGEHSIIAYFDVQVTANVSNTFDFNADNAIAYRCKSYASYNFGGGGSFTDGSAIECSFSAKIGTANDGVLVVSRGNVINCYVESRSTGSGTNGGAGIRFNPDYRSYSLCGNLIVEKRTNPGASNGITSYNGTQAQNNIISNNTIHKFGNAGIQIDQGVAATVLSSTSIYGNLFYDLTYGIEHLQRTNSNSFHWAAYNNAYGAVSSGQTTGITENFDPIINRRSVCRPHRLPVEHDIRSGCVAPWSARST